MGMIHGTTTCYTHHHCRCDECKAAQTAYSRRRYQAMRAGTWQPKPKAKLEPIPCSFDGCDRVAKYHAPPTLCNGHLQQHQRGVELTPLKPKNKIRDGRKVCTMCGLDLPLSDYYQQTPGRPQTRCKVCTNIATRSQRYGVPVDEMAQMMQRACAGCGATGLTGRNLHIDHCHDSGKVRGVLCRSCNLILTKTATPATLRHLAAYLEADI